MQRSRDTGEDCLEASRKSVEKRKRFSHLARVRDSGIRDKGCILRRNQLNKLAPNVLNPYYNWPAYLSSCFYSSIRSTFFIVAFALLRFDTAI